MERAAERYGVDPSKSFVVGDHPHDVQFARNAGARGIYVLTGHGRKHLPELPADALIASGMTEAAETIMSKGLRQHLCERKTINDNHFIHITTSQS
jgi:D-glycero-D-manno-heptose 1,7-bisphosphate phosphatase